MKELDSVTLKAIARVLAMHCNERSPGISFRLQTFCSRAGAPLTLDRDTALRFHRGADPAQDLAHHLNGTDDFERMLLRLASPKEHAGNNQMIDYTVRKLNQALWPEGLKITFSGIEPCLAELTTNEDRPEGQAVSEPQISKTEATMNDEIFIVHGRDIGTKDTVARFIGELGLKPIVLQELPNGGRTIIEKFEDYAQTRFAIAIFTPDDQGSLVVESSNPKPRTRQNVIFEFGYFIGKLGRDRACALIKGEVEIPSDYSGVLYITLDDADGWKLKLIQELQYAGYEVDANVLTRR